MKNLDYVPQDQVSSNAEGQDRQPYYLSRRDFLRGGLAALAAPLYWGCGFSSTEPVIQSPSPTLSAKPGTPTLEPVFGLSEIGLAPGRDGLLYVPESYSPDTPMPLFVALHGAGGGASNWQSYHARAETRGMILLIPNSRGVTWDLIQGSFGIDVEFLDRALAHTFERYYIDPDRLALGGFSDGATYALSLGLSNGDLFSHLVAFSPGFMVRTPPLQGKPRIFVSHGTDDGVLPVTQSRNIIVPTLRNDDYDVVYEEFEGGHQVPAQISETALDWFLQPA